MPPFVLSRPLSGYRPADAGVLAHALIALLAPTLPTTSDVALAERILDLGGALVGGANVNRRNVLLASGAGHAAAYLRRFAPTAPWQLLGCEFDTGNGRADLAWQHAQTGVVFFDEIKTSNRPLSKIPPDWVAQVDRYAHAGSAKYGDEFAGVRLVALGSLHLNMLTTANASGAKLSSTPTEPLRLAGGAS